METDPLIEDCDDVPMDYQKVYHILTTIFLRHVDSTVGISASGVRNAKSHV